MNTKYILIIIVLAAIVGGGILGYQYWRAPKVVEVPKEGVEELADEMLVVYSVQEDSSNSHHSLYTVNLSGPQKIKLLAEYQSAHLSGTPLPKVSQTGLVVYVDLGHKDQLRTVDLEGNKTILAEAEKGYEIGEFAISSDGSTVLYQELDSPESWSCSKTFRLWKIDVLNGTKKQLFASTQNYLSPISFSSASKNKAFVLEGQLTEDIADCFGPATPLQTIDLESGQLSSIKTSYTGGAIISPDEGSVVVAFSTNPASPLISTPSKEYPIKMTLVDLASGIKTTLVESSERYLFPIGWYSNSQSILFREQAPDTTENYKNIPDKYKLIDTQSKQITELFNLPRRGAGMEYNQIVNDSILVYTVRNHPDWVDGTSLFRINLDGSNRVELDRKIRFLHLIGVSE